MTSLFGTFGFYLFRRFITTILAVFFVVFLLIFAIDSIEVFRSAASSSTVSLMTVFSISLMRTPAVAEQIIPFATLFGAMIAFLNLARRLELVVIRASGVSVWQFIMPPIMAAGVLGLIAILAFNPLSARLKSIAEDRTFSMGKTTNTTAEEIWLRQKTEDGSAVIRAYRASISAPNFDKMTIFSFDQTGRFLERYYADQAELRGAAWKMKNVRIISPGVEARVEKEFSFPTNLTAEQVRQSLTPPETISFYDLPDWAARLSASGLDANRYVQQYRSLLARPFLLIAMILVAASVSLRFSRFGVSGKAILAGLASGFALYIVNKISSDLGAVGTFSTSFAAFFPPVLASLIGILALLHQEDG